MPAIAVASVAPVLQIAGAYTAGRPLGTLLSLPKMFGSAFAGVLNNIQVYEVGTQKAPLTLVFFKSAPVTAIVDNTALTLTAADLALVVAKVNVATADYETVGGVSIADAAAEQVNKVVLGSSTDLSLLVIGTGTPTFGTASALRIAVGVVRS